MPARIIPLVSGELYHIFNRGVAHQPTFNNKKDYERFMLSLSYYQYGNISLRLSKLLQLQKQDREVLIKKLSDQNDKIIDLIAFCLMPNHFHLLIKQNTHDGASRFLRLTINSYARYFNTKYQRVGPLFQGVFKVVRVETDEQLLHLSRYIHLNPLVSFIIQEKDLLSYPWSSLPFYLQKNSSNMVDPRSVLAHFPSGGYLEFVQDQANYGKELERIKHLVIE